MRMAGIRKAGLCAAMRPSRMPVMREGSNEGGSYANGIDRGR